jgi:hypothetical protein
VSGPAYDPSILIGGDSAELGNAPLVTASGATADSAPDATDCGPKSPPNAPKSVLRLFGYLEGVFRRGLRWWRLDFDLIARGTGMARRTVEWALAWIRRHWRERFSFRKLRVGSVYVVEVSDRKNPAPPIPPLRVGLRPNIKIQTRRSGFGQKAATPGPRLGALLRLAGFIARRELAEAHWDNCKVSFGFGHAFRFALSALRRGFDRARIRHAYESALKRRHGDATDFGLNSGQPVSVRWSPSSTVSLANRLLIDGLTDSERISARLESLAPIKAANAALRAQCRASFSP